MKNIFEDIFGGKFKREISELYISMAIRNLAAWMLDIFEPIFIYTVFRSLKTVVLFYAIVYTVYVFILPLGGKIACRYGFEHSILFSIPAIIAYYLILYNMPQYPYLCFYLAALIFALSKILFWPAYHANFAHYGNAGNRGGEVSGMFAISSFIGIIGPLLGGIIIARFGFKVLYVIGALLYFVSAIPLFSTIEKFHPAYFSYKDAFKKILNPRGAYSRKDQVAFLGTGEELSVLVMWPMFIYLSIGNFAKIGGLVAVSMLVVSLVAVYVGRISNDEKHRKKLFKWSAILNSLIWIAKPFLTTSGGIFAVDAVSRNIYSSIWVPFTASNYKKGEQAGFLRYMMFFEMNLAIGKALFAWILILVLCFTQSWIVLFGITGAAGLLYLNLK